MPTSSPAIRGCADSARPLDRDALIERFMPMVSRAASQVARRYRSADVDALESDGMLALVRLGDRCDELGHVEDLDAYIFASLRLAMIQGISRVDPLRNIKRAGLEVPRLLSFDAPVGNDGDSGCLLDLVDGGDDSTMNDAETDGKLLVQRVAERLPRDLARVVIGRFIDDLSITELAMEMNTTDEHVQRLFGAALAAVENEIEAGSVPALKEAAMSIQNSTRAAGVAPITDRDAAKLAHLSTTELKSLLAESLRITSEHVRRAATIIRVLRERGEDLSAFQGGLFRYLERVSDGRLIPDVLIKLTANPKLVDKLSGTTPELQRLVIRNEPVEVLFRSRVKESGYDRMMVEPIKLKEHMLPQLIAKDHLRSPSEQVEWLNRPAPRRADPPPPPQAMIVVDIDLMVLRVAGTSIPFDDLLRYVEQLRGAAAQKGAA